MQENYLAVSGKQPNGVGKGSDRNTGARQAKY